MFCIGCPKCPKFSVQVFRVQLLQIGVQLFQKIVQHPAFARTQGGDWVMICTNLINEITFLAIVILPSSEICHLFLIIRSRTIPRVSVPDVYKLRFTTTTRQHFLLLRFLFEQLWQLGSVIRKLRKKYISTNCD